jgi:hypothetical protein
VARLNPASSRAERCRWCSIRASGITRRAPAGRDIGRGDRAARQFLLDRDGAQLFDSAITILDDPLRPRGLRSRPFDGEGLPTAPRALVEAGRLTGWLMDSASARQLGAEPTGHARAGLRGRRTSRPATWCSSPARSRRRR